MITINKIGDTSDRHGYVFSMYRLLRIVQIPMTVTFFYTISISRVTDLVEICRWYLILNIFLQNLYIDLPTSILYYTSNRYKGTGTDRNDRFLYSNRLRIFHICMISRYHKFMFDRQPRLGSGAGKCRGYNTLVLNITCFQAEFQRKRTHRQYLL